MNELFYDITLHLVDNGNMNKLIIYETNRKGDGNSYAWTTVQAKALTTVNRGRHEVRLMNKK